MAAHSPEIARADDKELCGRRFGGRRRGLVRGREAGTGDFFREWEEVSGAGSLNAGRVTDFREDLLEVLRAFEIVMIGGGRSPDMHGEEMLGAETGIDGDEPGKAAKHKPGTDRKQKREGHLRDNKTAAKSLMAADTTAERSLLKCVLEIHAGETQRRN